MIRTIIVDDEKHCIDRLTTLLKEHFAEEVELIATASSVEEGVVCVKKQKPDLLFLDVQINDKTGFDLLKSLENPGFDLIFTTAFEKYAVQAFRFSAIDYLLKPVEAEELSSAIEKIIHKKTKDNLSLRIEELIKNTGSQSKKIGLPTLNGIVFIPVADIVRCEADSNYTDIFLKNKQKITSSKTLKEFEDLLTDYNFYRVHNSFLVNLDCVKSYNKGKGGSLQLSDGSTVEVSTRRKDDLLKKLSMV